MQKDRVNGNKNYKASKTLVCEMFDEEMRKKKYMRIMSACSNLIFFSPDSSEVIQWKFELIDSKHYLFRLMSKLQALRGATLSSLGRSDCVLASSF